MAMLWNNCYDKIISSNVVVQLFTERIISLIEVPTSIEDSAQILYSLKIRLVEVLRRRAKENDIMAQIYLRNMSAVCKDQMATAI